VLNADFRYWQILLQKSAAADGRSVISLRAASAMIDSTVGMVGDLHGIMGQAMPEISAIDEPPLLEGKAV
jgi:hypothetical protein